jgi:hypothetical protein
MDPYPGSGVSVVDDVGDVVAKTGGGNVSVDWISGCSDASDSPISSVSVGRRMGRWILHAVSKTHRTTNMKILFIRFLPIINDTRSIDS